MSEMEFFRSNVLISSSSPPEEILASIAGGCGFWQGAVILVSILSEFISGLDILSVRTSAPDNLRFTCNEGNSTIDHCLDLKGEKCKNFTFHKSYHVTSFSEKLNLVCDAEVYTFWIKNTYRFGLIIGHLVTGKIADKFGLKIAAMILISFQSLTGLMIISIKSVEILMFFVLTHGLFCTSISVIPFLAVCDVVGNRWRTLVLGIVTFSKALAFFTFPTFYEIFTEVGGAIAAVSVMPLILLIPLLYYKDSPNYIGLMEDFSKGEDILRRIAHFNRNPMSPHAKIRPVQILVDSKMPHRSSFFYIFKPRRTRKAYLAIICIEFCTGYCTSILMTYTYHDFETLTTFGICALIGCTISVILCHLVPHKMVIGIFGFLASVFTAGVFVYDTQWKETTDITITALRMTAGILIWTCRTAVDNLIPRMFPTELRAICYGLSVSVFHIGYLIEFTLRYFMNNMVVNGLVLLLSPILQTFCCFWLWDVHNRELPDFLIDSVRFNQFYKPTRYYCIYDQASQQEIEVKAVDLNLSERHPRLRKE